MRLHPSFSKHFVTVDFFDVGEDIVDRFLLLSDFSVDIDRVDKSVTDDEEIAPQIRSSFPETFMFDDVSDLGY